VEPDYIRKMERWLMEKIIGWSGVVVFFGLLTGADAQPPPSSTAGAAFDGTYEFVSSTKLAETYIPTGTSRMAQCPDRIPGPLTIVNGQPRFSISIPGKPAEFEGTLGSKGELAMRSVLPNTGARPTERMLNGRIDATGTVRARLMGVNCNYDFAWRKGSK
jgi:hypothetical protein